MAASYEETVKAIRARRSKSERDAKSGPGVIGALYRGMSKGFAPPVADRIPVQENSQFTPPPSAMTEDAYQDVRDSRFGPDPSNPSGISAPVTAPQRVAERVGELMPYIVAGAPVAAPIAAAGGAGALSAIGGEMALGTLGATVAESVAEAGGGTGAQLLSEIAATAAAPLAAPTRVAKRIGGATLRNADEIAVSAATRIAERYGVDPDAAIRAAAELKRKIARGVDDPEKYIDQSIQKLGQDITDFGEVTPTLAQSINREGGQNLASLEINYARQDQDYAADALGRRLDVQEGLESEFDAFRPAGDYDTAREAYQSARIDAVNQERAAWKDVPFEVEVDTTGIKRALKELREGPKAGRQYIPQEASVIDELADVENLDEIQALRSELLETQRAGSRFGAPDVDRRRSRRVAPLLDEIEKELDKLPDEGGDAYRRARQLTRENKSRFDPKSPAIEAISERTDPEQLVKRIMSAGTKDSPAEARRIAEILSGQPGGIESLQTVFLDNLVGESLGSRTARQMAKSYDRAVYKEIFGESGADFIEKVIRKQRVAQTGKAGTAAQAASTGTGQSAVEQLLSLSGDARNPLWSASSKFARHVANSALSREEVIQLIRLASQDIRLAKALLEVPVPRAEPAWRVIFDLGVQRARNEAAATAARRASREIGDVPPQGE